MAPSSLGTQMYYWPSGRLWIWSKKSLLALVMLTVVMSIVTMVGSGGFWDCCNRMLFSYLKLIGEIYHQHNLQIDARPMWMDIGLSLGMNTGQLWTDAHGCWIRETHGIITTLDGEDRENKVMV